MAHKGLRHFTSDTLGNMTYDQIGFDMIYSDHTLSGGKKYKEFIAGPKSIRIKSFGDGTDGDGTDTTVTVSEGHGLVNGDTVTVSGTANYNGTYTIDEVGTLVFDIGVNFNSGETVGSENTQELALATQVGTAPQFYLDLDINHLSRVTPHWIGIHNCGTGATETVEVFAKSLVGDDLGKATYVSGDQTLLNQQYRYIELGIGDTVYGLFSHVSIYRTNESPYVDQVRLIRGV